MTMPAGASGTQTEVVLEIVDACPASSIETTAKYQVRPPTSPRRSAICPVPGAAADGVSDSAHTPAWEALAAVIALSE
jgi:hypothetical protein